MKEQKALKIQPVSPLTHCQTRITSTSQPPPAKHPPHSPPRLRISPRCGLQVLGIRGPGVGKRGVSTWLCGAQDQPDRKFQVSLAPGSRITNGAGCFSRGVPTPHPGTLGSGPGPRAHKACLPQGHSRGTRGEACRRPEV